MKTEDKRQATRQTQGGAGRLAGSHKKQGKKKAVSSWNVSKSHSAERSLQCTTTIRDFTVVKTQTFAREQVQSDDECIKTAKVSGRRIVTKVFRTSAIPDQMKCRAFEKKTESKHKRRNSRFHQERVNVTKVGAS